MAAIDWKVVESKLPYQVGPEGRQERQVEFTQSKKLNNELN